LLKATSSSGWSSWDVPFFFFLSLLLLVPDWVGVLADLAMSPATIGRGAPSARSSRTHAFLSFCEERPD
jgi:hypothetical protein